MDERLSAAANGTSTNNLVASGDVFHNKPIKPNSSNGQTVTSSKAQPLNKLGANSEFDGELKNSERTVLLAFCVF